MQVVGAELAEDLVVVLGAPQLVATVLPVDLVEPGTAVSDVVAVRRRVGGGYERDRVGGVEPAVAAERDRDVVAVDPVVVGSAEQAVTGVLAARVGVTAHQEVGPLRAVHVVVRAVAEDHVVLGAAEELVGVGVAPGLVGPGLAVDHVLAVVAVEEVAVGAAVQRVVAALAVDPVVAGPAAEAAVAHADALARVRGPAAHGAGHRAVVAEDDVGAVAAVGGVVADRCERVAAAGHGPRSVADDLVVAAVTEQAVGSAVAPQLVGARAAADLRVVAGLAGPFVAAVAAEQPVGVRATPDVVVAVVADAAGRRRRCPGCRHRSCRPRRRTR